MKVSEFVQTVATTVGNDALEGAIVLVALDRPVDRLIQLAQALDGYHPGRPSPWSHSFLIARTFSGAATPILDCTIRDKNNHIIWKEKLLDVLKTILLKSGGIYSGQLGDYDDPRVHPVGVKLLTTISASGRAKIVAAGRSLQAQGYRYDLPGLFRELFRLITTIPIPPGDKLLFCSAFCQQAYRDALGDDGDFKRGTKSQDILPDDLWYSALGRPFPPDVPTPQLHTVAGEASGSN